MLAIKTNPNRVALPTAEMQQEVANNIKKKLESLPAPNTI